VVLVWAAGLDQDAALVTATEAAVEHWREVWGAAGVEVAVRYATSALDPALPLPSAMSGDVVLAASQLAEPGEIALVIGDTVGAVDGGLYGVAGRVPSAPLPSELSAIFVGWVNNAGGDGVFSDDDVRLYGEVLAHEVGHFVGLCHPVSGTFDYWDALGDTPKCSTEAACESQLGQNLMYPVSICDGGVCVSTTQLTGEQRGVMHRYTGTL
jgi:hypothetical protein